MKKNEMMEAFQALDAKLAEPLTLLVGGGAAMLLAYGIPLSTHDVDGLPFETNLSPAQVEKLVREVASELGLSPHWYNDYFNTFTFTLPADFRERLVDVFQGTFLTVRALGAEDLLLMKCMAGREKDVGHARALLRRGADWKRVEARLESLSEKGLPGAEEAQGFLEDLIVELEDA
jgi:predicted nucleotidyltransferase